MVQLVNTEGSNKEEVIARLKRQMAATQQKLEELEKGHEAAAPSAGGVSGEALSTGAISLAGSAVAPSGSGVAESAVALAGSEPAGSSSAGAANVAPPKARPKAIASGSVSSTVGSEWLFPPAAARAGGGGGHQQAAWGNNIGRQLLSLIRWGGKVGGRGRRVFIDKVEFFKVDVLGIEDARRWARLSDLAAEIRCSQEHLAREIHRVQVESGHILR